MNSQLANLSFFFLLGSMILYWVGPLSRDLFSNPFSSKVISSNVSFNNSNATSNIVNSTSEISLSESDILLKIKYRTKNILESIDITQILQQLGHYGIVISNILLVLLLCNRWKESGHFPLSNLYESLMFLSWSFTFIHLVIENLTKSETLSSQSTLGEKNISRFIGAITTPSALFTNAFATFTLPKEMQTSSSLVPALQSNWLMMHVTVMIISYAALIFGSLLSIAFLVITVQPKNSSTIDTQNRAEFGQESDQVTASMSGFTQGTLSAKVENLGSAANKRNSIASTLDNLSYRILGIGFPFLTIGILSGAVWANESWGSYWSWDPKETWAFLTWLVYAIYLHTRLNKGWEGKNPAIIASLGFVVVWICYLGVNLIGEGLHSYGWIQQ